MILAEADAERRDFKKVFSLKRYEEGYDVLDQEYQAWLQHYHQDPAAQLISLMIPLLSASFHPLSITMKHRFGVVPPHRTSLNYCDAVAECTSPSPPAPWTAVVRLC